MRLNAVDEAFVVADDESKDDKVSVDMFDINAVGYMVILW